MKITSISVQARDKNRVNVSVDGKYRFSLDITQVADLGIRVGKEYEEAELVALEEESQFGKLYTRALEYCLSRPHSRQEVQQYLYRKTRPKRIKTGELKDGVSVALTERVFSRLDERGYLNDESFARYWAENRQLRKGISQRKLQAELRAKGVSPAIIEEAIGNNERDDSDELKKVIEKKARRYDDPQKLIAYLARQGFSYDDIKSALAEDDT
jgi:regulatory protein